MATCRSSARSVAFGHFEEVSLHRRSIDRCVDPHGARPVLRRRLRLDLRGEFGVHHGFDEREIPDDAFPIAQASVRQATGRAMREILLRSWRYSAGYSRMFLM